MNLDSLCYVIFKTIDHVNDEPIWQQTHYCYWYDQSRGGLCANEDACTFTLDELAKTMYKCYKTVQSPREFKETFPRYFCLKERMNLQYPTHSTAFKLSWSIFQLVVLVVQLQFIWEPNQSISQDTSIVLYEMYIGRSLKKMYVLLQRVYEP